MVELAVDFLNFVCLPGIWYELPWGMRRLTTMLSLEMADNGFGENPITTF